MLSKMLNKQIFVCILICVCLRAVISKFSDANYEDTYLDSDVQGRLPAGNAPTCFCDKEGTGSCEKNEETGETDCVCNPGYGAFNLGVFTKSLTCKKCDCGQVVQDDGSGRHFGCKFSMTIFSNSKDCICDEAGYYDKNGVCQECLCGQRYDGMLFNCSSTACDCGKGYVEMSHKCKAIDICSLEPCVRDGKCENLEDGFKCICQPGFGGRLCEKRVKNACNSNPCFNNGVCMNTYDDDDSGFICECPKGSQGKRCEQCGEDLTSEENMNTSDTLATIINQTSSNVDTPFCMDGFFCKAQRRERKHQGSKITSDCQCECPSERKYGIF